MTKFVGCGYSHLPQEPVQNVRVRVVVLLFRPDDVAAAARVVGVSVVVDLSMTGGDRGCCGADRGNGFSGRGRRSG